jgi:hypothetical protein
LVISEEFSGWVGSLRRFDLLGIDPDGTLVVFELKRTEDGGNMDLQGIRYAAMASLLSFKEVVDVYAAHLAKHQPGEDAEALLREHLEPGSDADVAAKVRIVLVSGDFGPEITTTVLWLRGCSLDIRCVRLVPYEDAGSIYLDAQQIIPVPEAADYLLKLREREERNEVARQGERDFTRFIVCHPGGRTVPLPKRRAMLEIIRTLVSQGSFARRAAAGIPDGPFSGCRGAVTVGRRVHGEAGRYCPRPFAGAVQFAAVFHGGGRINSFRGEELRFQPSVGIENEGCDEADL